MVWSVQFLKNAIENRSSLSVTKGYISVWMKSLLFYIRNALIFLSRDFAPPPPPNFVFNGRYIYLFTSILQVRLNENIYLLTQTTQDKQKQKDK